jgi:hypothetical protein
MEKWIFWQSDNGDSNTYTIVKVDKIYMFHSEFLDPLSSFSVWYKSESNIANDSKKEDLSQLFGI